MSDIDIHSDLSGMSSSDNPQDIISHYRSKSVAIRVYPILGGNGANPVMSGSISQEGMKKPDMT